MTRLWKLWMDYRDRIPYPPSERRFARDLGMSQTAFNNWQHGISRLPDRFNLARFARLISMPYERVLDAALHDAGYLPEPREEVMGNAEHPAPTSKPGAGPDNVAALLPSVQVRGDLEDGRKAARRTRSGQPTLGQRRRADSDAAGQGSQETGSEDPA